MDKRRLLLVTQSGLILCALGLGILAIEGTVKIWHVLFFAGLSGLFASFDMPTRQSFVAEMVGREDLPSAVALNSSIFNAARALGPAVAGLLLAARVSIGAAFLGNAVLSLAVIAGLLLIRVPRRPAGPDAPKADNTLRGVWASTREGFAYVAATPTVRNLVILVGSFGLFAFSFNVLIPGLCPLHPPAGCLGQSAGGLVRLHGNSARPGGFGRGLDCRPAGQCPPSAQHAHQGQPARHCRSGHFRLHPFALAGLCDHDHCLLRLRAVLCHQQYADAACTSPTICAGA